MDLSDLSDKWKITRTIACRILDRVREIKESMSQWPEPTAKAKPAKRGKTPPHRQPSSMKAAAADKPKTKPKSSSTRSSSKGQRQKKK